MSFQSGDACFPTALSANTASAAREQGSIKLIGTAQYVVDVVGVSDTSITYAFRPVSGGSVLGVSSVVNPVQCQLLQAADAVQVGWMIGGVWIAAYAITYLARVVNGFLNGGSDDGSNA